MIRTASRPGRLRRRLGRLSRRLGLASVPDEAPRWPVILVPVPDAAGVRRLSPDPGSRIAPGLTLFHDAGRNAPFDWSCPRSGAGAALVLTVYGADASYLSLAAGVPAPLAARLTPDQNLLLRIEARVTRPLNLFLRLNLSADSRHEVVHEAMILSDGAHQVRFSLAGRDLAFGPRLSAWVDIIRADPAMTEITITALSLDRLS